MIECQLCVIGGGLSGLIAAIAAARCSIDTVLIQDRPVLGGNASSEFRMHICGADNHMKRPDARETGILEEILLENKRRNPDFSWPIFDLILYEKASAEKHLTLFLNTYMHSVKMKDGRISSVSCFQMTNERQFSVTADFFIDATGDGSLSAKSGAVFRLGREARDEFGESLAPQTADSVTMGSSLMFKARKLDHPVKFIRPENAYTFTEDDLRMRDHSDVSSGYWWIELGGDGKAVIDDAEEIHDELLKTVYGVWDHIKNSPSHNADNYDLEWVSPIAGKRESRRVEGDYILRQADINEARIFPDAVAYGGWPMDIHTAGGFASTGDVPTVWNHVGDVYTIPYRCFYSKNIPNLFLAGRIISTSHVAFSSSRVMGTCAVGAEAVGNAAAIAVKRGLREARDVCAYISELQQKLLRDDVFIPGFRDEDDRNLARTAQAEATEERPDGAAVNVINGIARSWKGQSNAWICRISSRPVLTLRLRQAAAVSEVIITFDSNLSREITPSIIREVIARQEPQSPSTLVDEFSVSLYRGGKLEEKRDCRTMGQRHVRLNFSSIEADRIELQLHSSFGQDTVKVFEVRVY